MTAPHPDNTPKPVRGSARAKRRRQRNERWGRWAETVAALWLMGHGYRILARREKTPFGEIDLIGKRATRVAFVEVKWRSDLADARTAVSPRQAQRIAQAAEYWLWRQPVLRTCTMGLDCIYVAPYRFPKYVPNALQPT